MMRGSITALLFATLAGCSRSKPPEVFADFICPDPRSCTQSNGNGVYIAENGLAGLGRRHVVITHFVNKGSSVGLEGGFFLPPQAIGQAPIWRAVSDGEVFGADYGNTAPGTQAYQVVSVSETSTVPTWTVRLRKGPFPNTTVSGDQVRQLTLYVRFVAAGETEQYVLRFDGPATVQVGPNDRRPATSYGMMWSPTITSGRTPYCLGPRSTSRLRQPDPVVFQQGIDVDAVTGKVTAATDKVTISCYLGALATVYRWNYDYAGTDRFYFDAGIQMKRASYCANAEYYTTSGTQILIRDDKGIHNDPITALEASWGEDGALCIDPQNLRHPDIALQKQFTRTCPGRQPALQVPCPDLQVVSSQRPHLLSGSLPRP